jgi:hypothetical protein
MRTAGFVFAGAEKIYSACIFFAGRFLFYIIQGKNHSAGIMDYRVCVNINRQSHSERSKIGPNRL